MAARQADITWEGTLKEGKGKIKLSSGAFEGAYSFSTRFEEGTGTNPEELIAAANAACFSMKLGAQLEAAGFPAALIHTVGKAHLGKNEAGDTSIVRITLDTEGSVPGVDEATFLAEAEKARANCIITRALAGVEIELNAKLLK